jgi:hypothetical protein
VNSVQAAVVTLFQEVDRGLLLPGQVQLQHHALEPAPGKVVYDNPGTSSKRGGHRGIKQPTLVLKLYDQNG